MSILILAHGAGAGMEHSFMTKLSDELVLSGITVLRFNFPYIDAGRKSPGSPKPNVAAWNVVLDYAINQFDVPIFLSGKSYGGRMASHLLAENETSPVNGIIYFGFPLHAPGRDSKDRADHLAHVDTPQLFLQGTKDTLANPQLINEVCEGLKQAEIIMIEGGDHSFKVKGTKHDEVIRALATHTSKWVNSQVN